MSDQDQPALTASPEVAPSIPPAQPVSETTPEAGPAPAATPTPAPAKKSHWWLVVLALVVIVVAAGGWYMLKHRHHNTIAATVVTKKDIPLLTFGFYNNPLNAFYPTDAGENGAYAMNGQIFDGLVQYNKGTQIVPNLAASWTNPNNSTWVFKIKPNVYYHDGNTVTAQDVVYTWQQITSNTKFIASVVAPTIKNVQALDSSTVQITTTSPDPILLNRLATMWIIDSKAPAGTQPWELGAGAYTVKPGTTPTENTIDLVAFDKYHGGHIYTKAINYIFYPDSSKAIADLKAGKLDLTDSPSDTTAADLEQAGLAAYTPSALYVDIVAFNTKVASYPTANSKIREAFDLTIDPAKVLKAYGITGTVIDQTVPLQVPGYNPAIKRPAIDLTKAKQLVQAAGYPNGVTINLGIGEPAKSVGQELAKELAPVGINLNVEVATDEGTFFKNINNGTYQAFYEGNGTNINDASDVLSFWQQASFYDNPTLDAQLDAANQTFNSADRLVKLQQAVATITNDYGYIPLYQDATTVSSRKGIVFPLDVYDGDLNTRFADVYQQ